MTLDFSQMGEKAFPQFKGGEKALNAAMYAAPEIKIMRGRLEPEATIGTHTHDTSAEIIYILSGHATVVTPEGNEELEAGQCHYCPKGHTHSLQNRSEEDLTFFAVVPEV